MSRIPGIDPQTAEPAIKAVFEAQARKWGGPLFPSLVFGHRPSIFKAVRGMWAGLDASGLIDPKLIALVNRRVAAHNRCVF